MTGWTELPIPPWLDWSWALRTLWQEVRAPGELVDLAAERSAWVHEASEGPVEISVEVADGLLRVGSAASLDEAVAAVVFRFHLDLPEEGVTQALQLAGVPGLDQAGAWTRKPAAASGWAHCLTYLAGGDPDDPSIRRLFDELGGPSGDSPDLRSAPRPDDVLRAGAGALVDLGIKPSRAQNLVRLAQVFLDEPDRHDAAQLRSLDPHDAVGCIAELPHIGAKRAPYLAAGAWGHDDVSYKPTDIPILQDRVGLSWPDLLTAIERASPFRSVACDTLAVIAEEA